MICEGKVNCIIYVVVFYLNLHELYVYLKNSEVYTLFSFIYFIETMSEPFVQVNAYPWIAALVIDNEKDPDYVQSTCSAVLVGRNSLKSRVGPCLPQIGSNWMVTAAHCLYRQEVLLPATSLTLVLGLHDKSDSTEGTR